MLCVSSLSRRALPLTTRGLAAPVLSRGLRASAIARAEGDAAAGGLNFTFTVPTKSLYEDASVEMVILPGGDGQYGVMPNHVPTVAELKPGVVYVQETAGSELTKYFVSGGFATGNEMLLSCTRWRPTIRGAVSQSGSRIPPEASPRLIPPLPPTPGAHRCLWRASAARCCC